MTLTLQHFLVLSVVLFAIGAAGAVSRRNALVIFMSIEIMFAAAGLAMLAFARWNLLPAGKAVALFFIAVMSVEAAVGLALAVALLRRRGTLMVDEATTLGG